MAERKIFAGPQVRRIRNALALTQTAMAEALEISPSYLNLIERNQRPLTVQLAAQAGFRLPRSILRNCRAKPPAVSASLKEVFADPLLAGEVPGDQELVEVAEAAPNAARGMIKLYRAYREQAARLSDLAALMAGRGARSGRFPARAAAGRGARGAGAPARLFRRIEDAAETFRQRPCVPAVDPEGLAEAASAASPLRILPRPCHAGSAPPLRPPLDAPFPVRAPFAGRSGTARWPWRSPRSRCGRRSRPRLRHCRSSSDEARRIARFELARYAALALLMPYGAFLLAAQSSRYDIDLMRARFAVSFDQAREAPRHASASGRCRHSLLHDGDRCCGQPSFGGAGAQGFPQARFGGSCPKLNIHAAFLEPGRVLAETVDMPDGSAFLTIARTLEGPMAGFGERGPAHRYAGRLRRLPARQSVYGRGAALPVAVGPACRLCERPAVLRAPSRRSQGHLVSTRCCRPECLRFPVTVKSLTAAGFCACSLRQSLSKSREWNQGEIKRQSRPDAFQKQEIL